MTKAEILEADEDEVRRVIDTYTDELAGLHCRLDDGLGDILNIVTQSFVDGELGGSKQRELKEQYDQTQGAQDMVAAKLRLLYDFLGTDSGYRVVGAQIKHLVE